MPGESIGAGGRCHRGWPHSDLVTRVLQVSDVVPRMGEAPVQHMATLEVVLVPGATERALLRGHTLHG